jgi:hypothetical protein
VAARERPFGRNARRQEKSVYLTPHLTPQG